MANNLEMTSISKRFGGIRALSGVTFSARGGEVHALLGENGAGKSTLMRILSGDYQPDEGSVSLDDETLSLTNPRVARDHGIAVIYQEFALCPDLSVAENIEIPLAAGAGRYGPLSLLGYRPDAARRDRLLDLCGLAGKAGEKVGEIAHGEKQRLEIAMLLARDAELILLDEPTAGMSGAETSAVASLIRRLRDEEGKSILVIEHDMNFVRQLECPIIVMVRGKIIAEGRYEEVSRDPRVIESYLGKRH